MSPRVFWDPLWDALTLFGTLATLLNREWGAATRIDFALRVTNADFLTIRSPPPGTTPALGMSPAERRGESADKKLKLS